MPFRVGASMPLREFLRGGRDVVAADRAALGGCRPGTHAPGHALDWGEDPQSQTLSRTPQIPAPAAALPGTSAEGQPATRETAAAGGADSCQGETGAPICPA